MSAEMRWTIVLFVLMVAGVVALWPRGDDDLPASTATSGAGMPRYGVDIEANSPSPDDRELASLRQRAELRPCPQPALATPEPGGPLAGIRLRCLGSPGSVDLGTAFAGRPALLNVWASWCQPCREEIPVLARYADEPGALPVIGVNVLDRPSDALELLDRLGARYPSVVDSSGDLRAALRTPPVLPTTYVVLPDGSVERVNPPEVFRSTAQIHRTVQDYLTGPP